MFDRCERCERDGKFRAKILHVLPVPRAVRMDIELPSAFGRTAEKTPSKIMSGFSPSSCVNKISYCMSDTKGKRTAPKKPSRDALVQYLKMKFRLL